MSNDNACKDISQWLRTDASAHAALAFDDAMAGLETIVGALEGGELSLEDAIRAFEVGSHLRNLCLGKLDDARLRLGTIVRDPQGRTHAVPISDDNARDT